MTRKERLRAIATELWSAVGETKDELPRAHLLAALEHVGACLQKFPITRVSVVHAAVVMARAKQRGTTRSSGGATNTAAR